MKVYKLGSVLLNQIKIWVRFQWLQLWTSSVSFCFSLLVSQTKYASIPSSFLSSISSAFDLNLFNSLSMKTFNLKNSRRFCSTVLDTESFLSLSVFSFTGLKSVRVSWISFFISLSFSLRVWNYSVNYASQDIVKRKHNHMSCSTEVTVF